MTRPKRRTSTVKFKLTARTDLARHASELRVDSIDALASIQPIERFCDLQAKLVSKWDDSVTRTLATRHQRLLRNRSVIEPKFIRLPRPSVPLACKGGAAMKFWQRLTAASRRPAAAVRDLHLAGRRALQRLPQPVRRLAGRLHHRADHGLEDRRAGALPVLGSPSSSSPACARSTCAPMHAARPQLDRHRGRPGNGSCATSSARPPMSSLMGIWCLLAFVKTSDPFVQIFSFSLTLAYMIGISGQKLRQQSAGDRADRLRRHSDDAGAVLGRRRLLRDLRLRAGAVLRHA